MSALGSMFLMTFVLEDVALAGATALVLRGDVSFAAAATTCALGIALGDLCLYALGRIFRTYGRSWPRTRLSSWVWAWLERKASDKSSPFSARSMDLAVFVSRAVPGTRIPVYLAAGLTGFGIVRFSMLTAASVALWVSFVIAGGGSVFSVVASWSGNWIWAALVAVAIALFVRRTVIQLFDRWERRLLAHAWRRWLSFEFWPAWLFYAPVVPWVAWLMLKGRTWRAPFLVDPAIPNGGWIGESKWILLSKLNEADPATPRQQVLPGHDLRAECEIAVTRLGLRYPFILKPDVGQRGYGVRLIRTPEDVIEYANVSRGPVIVQEASPFECEAGLFYARRPCEDRGRIISVTDKSFPFVVGDGTSSLGQLILRDRRARIIASVYFTRHRARLNDIIEAGQVFALSECGNHCQGAIFHDGRALVSPALVQRIDEIAQQLPGFFFGRFDVRYRDRESLMRGEHFHIIEINGAGSESTHIWDASTRLIDAYRALFAQWQLLFEIGMEIERSRDPQALLAQRNVSLGGLLKECARVWRRQNALSVSS